MTFDLSGRRVLVLAYGNPGRQDDGLGPAAAEVIERWAMSLVKVETSYLLNIEDASTLVEHDVVLFIDAAAEGPEPFELRRVEPAGQMVFTSHIVRPEVLLAICRDCYGRVPEAWLLGIRGYEFELVEALTERARSNLEQALALVYPCLSP
jgi:hydrogenase maturation protease